MTTTYTKTVALFNASAGLMYEYESSGGAVYLTPDIARAKDFRDGESPPDGFRLTRLTRTKFTPDLGGGYYVNF